MKRGSLTITLALLLASAGGCSRPEERKAATAQTGAAQTAAGDAAVKADGLRPVRISAEGVSAAEPTLAAGSDGSAYVAWVEHQKGGGGELRLTRLDAEGAPAGEAARVNPEPGVAKAWRGDAPTVAVGPDGAVYVGWTARVEGAPHATALYLSVSHDGGRSFGAPVRVDDDTRPNEHGMHSLAVGRDGRVYVAWLDGRGTPPAMTMGAEAHSKGMAEPNREVYFAYSADGGRTFSRNRRVATEACPCCKTSLAVGEGGRVYLGWRQVLPGELRHIAVASSADGGETFSDPTVVSDDRWEINACPVSGPALAASGDAGLRVLWYTEGQAGPAGLYTSESQDGGRTFTPRRAVAEGGVRGTPQLLPDGRGGLVAVYDDGAVKEARLDGAGGTAVAPAPIVVGEAPTAALRGGQLYATYISDGSIWLVRAG